ncbi:hypothetical protein [Komagataeibacter oboediens]|uniref:hypothetical protein n=1 Tax=Komagataeibacter oboediens TaxID=65958 RepID=UPI001C2BAF60|nr:hypothetical protein [Komagataeibacter oboediens]
MAWSCAARRGNEGRPMPGCGLAWAVELSALVRAQHAGQDAGFACLRGPVA